MSPKCCGKFSKIAKMKVWNYKTEWFCLIIVYYLEISFNFIQYCKILCNSVKIYQLNFIPVCLFREQNLLMCYAQLSQLPSQFSDTIYKLSEANQASTMEWCVLKFLCLWAQLGHFGDNIGKHYYPFEWCVHYIICIRTR